MIYVILYLAAIVAANLSVAQFGANAVYVNAFLFIGLDLVARDKLHDLWQKSNLLRNMALLIAAGSLLSYALNRNADVIALASFSAFACAAVVDTCGYHLLRGRAKWMQVNGSNIPAAMVDSLVFPAIAFGGLFWPIVIGQFVAKVAGGFFWAFVIQYSGRRERESVSVISAEK